MRVLPAIVACALVLAACGADEPSPPAAAADDSVVAAARAEPAGEPVLAGSATRLNGERDSLARYRGDVVLVVNTASACGYTRQFEPLEELYRQRRADGFVLLGFPSNDFAGQEPRSDAEIAQFCEANFGVTFPMFSRTPVTGDEAHPLFRRLAAAAGEPEWNFNKYLLGRSGRVVTRFGAGTEPDDPEIAREIEALL